MIFLTHFIAFRCMPKSNFNQFLDECHDYQAVENNSVSKIHFETISHSHEKCDDQTIQNENPGKHHNESSVNSSSNSFPGSYTMSKSQSKTGFKKMNTQHSSRFNNSDPDSTSSNIFLSSSKKSNSNNKNWFLKNSNKTNENVQTNLFKNVNAFADPDPHLLRIPSTQMIEINNETFPSLPTSATTNTKSKSATVHMNADNTSNAFPKKIKNFKDAITCASASVPTPPASLKKEKQLSTPSTQYISQSRVMIRPPPLLVKRDSEMCAKKVLANAKNISTYYEDDDNGGDDDEDDSSDHIHEYSCSRRSRPTFIKRQFNNTYNDESDDD